MKYFATLMLMMTFGLSVAYSQIISVDEAPLDSQQFMDRVLKRQVDDDDDYEIVDMDDALNKLRMLRKVYRIVAETEADGLLHPKKRFIKDTFDKIVNFFKKAWNKAKEAFNKVAPHLDFKTIVDKVVPQIHSGMTVAACVEVVRAAATAIFGPAASIAAQVAKPVCDGALAKLEELAS